MSEHPAPSTSQALTRPALLVPVVALLAAAVAALFLHGSSRTIAGAVAGVALLAGSLTAAVPRSLPGTIAVRVLLAVVGAVLLVSSVFALTGL